MNMNDKVTQAEQWVLSKWHTWWGGVLIGYISHWPIGWILHAL